MLASKWVPKLPEVGGPILDKVAKIAELNAERDRLIAEAAKYADAIKQAEKELAQSVKGTWTDAEIAQAKAA